MVSELTEGELRCENWGFLHTVVLGPDTLAAAVSPGLLGKLHD